jgi:U3 small nucleolar RNA-associated protein 6
MADAVRHALEGMVPELEAYEKRGYFSRAEVRAIVRRRQDHEYALRRKAALRADYVRAAEYEQDLERLRALRRRALGAAAPKPGAADHAILRRVHSLYERATRRFRGDLSLWAAWARFCAASGARRQMSRVLTRALQLHPAAAPLWAYAAAWELERNGNAAAARALMQRGLRMCAGAPGAPGLWHEYFRLEALYAARLGARREVLGLVGGGESDAAAAAVLRGAVARVVYDGAVAALPAEPLAFRARFLDVLRPLPLPGAAELEAHILADIAAAFPGNPGAVELEARRRLRDGAGAGAAAEAFDAAAAGAAPARRAELLAAQLRLLGCELRSALAAGDAGAAAELAERCLASAARAAEGGAALADESLLAAARLRLRLGRPAEAAAAARREAGAAPSAAALRLDLGLQSLCGAAPDAVGAAALAAVRSAAGAPRADVWLAAVRAVDAADAPLAPLADEFVAARRGAARGPARGGAGAAAAALYRALWAADGPAAARRFAHALLALPLAGGEFVHAALDAELAAAAAGGAGAPAAAGVRALFEAGAAAYGAEDVELWLRYARRERAADGGGGGAHWRALKALRPELAEEFAARSRPGGA